MILPVIPVSPSPLSVDNELRTNDGGTVTLTAGVTAFLNVIKSFHNTATDYTLAELWSQPTPADDPLFIEVIEPAISGTSASAPTLMGQVIITHRTAVGGIHRLYLMNPINAPNTRATAPFPVGNAKALSDYMKGNTGWIYGRDGGRIVAPIAQTTKINDALRKKQMNL